MTPSSWLLDTHPIVWMLYVPERLSKAELTVLKGDVQLLASIVSIWEISLKMAKHGFDFSINENWDTEIPETLESMGIEILHITPRDCRVASELPFHHRDPFDRMLVAQAKVRGCGIVSRDGKLGHYGVALPERR